MKTHTFSTPNRADLVEQEASESETLISKAYSERFSVWLKKESVSVSLLKNLFFSDETGVEDGGGKKWKLEENESL